MDRLTRIGEGFLAVIQDRISLASTERQEEKFRLIQSCLWIGAGLSVGLLAIIFASLTIVVWFWDSARLEALLGLTGFYTAALIAVALAFRSYLARQPPPFAATLEELGQDRSCIQAKI